MAKKLHDTMVSVSFKNFKVLVLSILILPNDALGAKTLVGNDKKEHRSLGSLGFFDRLATRFGKGNTDDDVCVAEGLTTVPSWSELATNVSTTSFDMGCSRDPATVPLSAWAPDGVRLGSSRELNSPILPGRNAFFTLHATVRNDDTIGGTVLAPTYCESFTVEERAFLPEGPSFLADGTILFTPSSPMFTRNSTTNDFLVALDGKTGQRLWTVSPAQEGQGGAPLVLKDGSGNEVVFTGGSRSVVAVNGATGAVIWENFYGRNVTAGDHCYGISYHAPTDSVVALFLSGTVLAFTRGTGVLFAGFNFMSNYTAVPTVPQGAIDIGDDFPNYGQIFREKFDIDTEAEGTSFFAILYGVGVVVANYFSINPDTGDIYFVATLEDGHDGDTNDGDGFSEAAALWRFSLSIQGFQLESRSGPIAGGSGATPAISADGQRIYTADTLNQVLAYDYNCTLLYQVDARGEILGSVSPTPNNGEIFVASQLGVLKLIENADRTNATVDEDFYNATQASLNEIYAGYTGASNSSDFELKVISSSTITVADNAISLIATIGIAPCGSLALNHIPFSYELVLLDRETGELIHSTTLREETVSSLPANSGGKMVVANSPGRRLLAAAALNFMEDLYETYQPITGGITIYEPLQKLLIAREAICSAASRLSNLISYQNDLVRFLAAGEDQFISVDEITLSTETDLVDITSLIDQATVALDDALANGEIASVQGNQLKVDLGDVVTDLDNDDYGVAEGKLDTACLDIQSAI